MTVTEIIAALRHEPTTEEDAAVNLITNVIKNFVDPDLQSLTYEDIYKRLMVGLVNKLK